MASSSSSSIPAPVAYSQSWKNHVFLSFRGEDTRNNFVGHLYTALENKGIYTFKDDKKLSLGEAIDQSLTEAIEQSQIAIIIFSKHYADSSWCLNELRHIMKCRKERGLTAVPIFYGVDPTEVRKQEKNYGEAFAKYESVNNTNVASWRDALVEASGNSGQDITSGNMDESELIKNIVNKISKMIHPLVPRVNDNLVGVEARMDVLLSKLQIGSDCVSMIGLWGGGGGGKTTLATSIYSKISSEFDGCCCIGNIREESRKNDLAALQKKLISEVLKEKEVQIGSIDEGKGMIRERLKGKKVLIILDDVDQPDQLEALAGSIGWFGNGSRIIITTRNEHLLKAHEVEVHNISLLDDDEAAKLFRKCAGVDDRPMEDYEQVSKEVVSYACGLPLALTILGSDLRGRGVDEWKSTLARLKKIPENDILGRLRISYDGLKKVEQDLFLDIACFFRRKPKDEATEILSACGLYPDIGLKVLREKALITISDDERFDMHDLIQEMAHHIVRGEHPNNPEKHTRIWKGEDVVTICAMDPTTDLDMIEAIQYGDDEERANPLQHLPPIVANTKNLRWIDWQGDLSSPLLTNFPQSKVCYLELSDSLQKQLWEGYKYLPNLKMMKLWSLENLIMLPNFSGLPNLESFTLTGSPRLKEIDSSFELLEKLIFLSIICCPKIKRFPSINRLKNLKTLSLHGSPRIFKLMQHKMENLPYSLVDNSGYKKVKNRLKNLKTSLFHHTQLWFSLSELRKLDLSKCELRDDDIGSSKWDLPQLQELNLSSNKFSRLDFSPWQLPRLKWLCMSDCESLVELQNLPSSISVLDASKCCSLERFGDASNCKWLWKISNYKGYKLVPFHGERLLNYMLQGNAIDNHFISVTLENQIPLWFVGRFFSGPIFTSRHPHADRKSFTLDLPNYWYNDFSGFLIRLVTPDWVDMDIIMKKVPDKEESRFEIWQESNQAPEPEYFEKMRTCVGYVSFSSLRQTTPLNSSYNIISFSMKRRWSSFGAELVPMKNKDDTMQTTTNFSEFWEDKHSRSFTIQQDSKSNIKIHWYDFSHSTLFASS